MSDKKLKIAVTGGIGAGKSLFCRFLEEAGYPVIKADELAKELLAADEGIKTKIIKAFGAEAYKGNEVNRQYLADNVFGKPENVYKINSIVHPAVIKKTGELIKELHKKFNIVFTEAALIYEAEMEEMFDYVVLITADENTRRKRKLALKMPEEDFTQRNLNQISDEEKAEAADFVFVNNGSTADLKAKSKLLLMMLG